MLVVIVTSDEGSRLLRNWRLRRQFYDAVDGRRPNVSPTHIHLLARFEHDDIEAVADYLSRLPGNSSQPHIGAGGAVT